MKGNRALKYFTETLMLTLGSCIAAFAIEEFLVPCLILDGGVVGISMILSTIFRLPLSILTVCLNLPFIIIGARKLGKEFVLKSVWAMIVFAVALKLFEGMTDATEEHLLAVCYGGVILGIGVGLVIKSGGCLDGTEIVAVLLNRKFKTPVGTMVLFFNVFIYGAAGFLFGLDRAMYSLLTYFITSKIVDVIESGMEQAKAAFIITNDAKTIANEIYTRLGRTVTIMEGEGLVSGKKVVLYCVLTRFEIHELKSIINGIDQSAFVSVSDVSEIIGNHMKKNDGILAADH